MRANDLPTTGGVPFPMRFSIQTYQALDVLAGHRTHDDNGCKRDYHARLLNDADFLSDADEQEREEICAAVAADGGKTMPLLCQRMASILEDVL